MSGNLELIHVNLHHCKAANALLAAYIYSKQIQIALIQDPYLQENKLQSFPNNWSFFHSQDFSAWIVISDNSLIYNQYKTTTSAVLISIITHETPIIIGTQYAPPSVDLNQKLEEWQSSIPARNVPFFMSGDFNARSNLWGYDFEDQRGEEIIEFAAINDLVPANIEDSPPTFLTSRAKGWPDLTMVNAAGSELLAEWRVLDEETASDHAYITFKIQATPTRKTRSRYKTEYGRHGKFKHLLKQQKQVLENKLESTITTQDLESFTRLLIETLQQACNQTYKKKNTGIKTPLKWWTKDLAINRNKVRALSRKLKRATDEEKPGIRVIYNKHHAMYKKAIQQAKRKAWIDFTSQNRKPYGTAFKMAHNRCFKPDEIQVDWGGTAVTKEDSMCKLTEHIFGNNASNPDIKTLKYTAPQDLPFEVNEVKNALFSLNVKKAPGPDALDFRVLRQAFEVIPLVLHRWTNLCMKLTYFPSCLKIGEVVYFLKQGKNPQDPSSYRPICLLPTLGKLLEKLLVQRLVHHLEKNNKLEKEQFGFRNNNSCENAIAYVLDQIKAFQTQGHYCAMISIDIKGAFDNLPWHKIKFHLQEAECPANVAGTIASYLDKRQVLVNWGAGKKMFEATRGCPQGSCLGPVLWLLAADAILKECKKQRVTIAAYADDFVIMVGGRTRKDLEEAANACLESISKSISNQELSISDDKSFSLLFSKPKQLKRNPIFKMNGKTIRQVKTLKYLGLTFDNRLSWLPHINNLKAIALQSQARMHRLAPKTWGISTFNLKYWFNNATLPSLLYAASAWANSLTINAQNKLLSVQRTYLLRISRCYRTVSTEALQIITGVPPITLLAKMAADSANLLRLSNIPNNLPEELENLSIEMNIPKWLHHPAKDHPKAQVVVETSIPRNTAPLQIYTDGSRTNEGVGTAFCVYKDGALYYEQNYRLPMHSTVFQAEMQAIFQALSWLKQCKEASAVIYSDSKSSLQLLLQHRTTNAQAFAIKHLLETAPTNMKITLAHIKAHTGIVGNERADELAKNATKKETIDINIPAPPSYVKKN